MMTMCVLWVGLSVWLCASQLGQFEAWNFGFWQVLGHSVWEGYSGVSSVRLLRPTDMALDHLGAGMEAGSPLPPGFKNLFKQSRQFYNGVHLRKASETGCDSSRPGGV